MENLINWLTALNKTNHVWFGVATVVIMSGLGALIGSSIEVFFKVLGIKSNKIEIHH
ncbi:MAG: hypothetical protein HQK88_08570 [Nitrospirae bacterium]|nr:hypothetical protein [Nitrospirota bacterium]MBF0536119.1 hypothetical protein [Nitrospirota bacterium]MBF0616855.1 hypothetical protein [Nitrospirota bacterium]